MTTDYLGPINGDVSLCRLQQRPMAILVSNLALCTAFHDCWVSILPSFSRLASGELLDALAHLGQDEAAVVDRISQVVVSTDRDEIGSKLDVVKDRLRHNLRCTDKCGRRCKKWVRIKTANKTNYFSRLL